MKTAKGLALVSVLFVVTGLMVVTATLFFSLFIDGQAVANLSAGDDALYAAEAGIQHLWSILDPAADFSRERAWPNGEPPFPSPSGFPEPPRTYRVQLSALADGGLRAVSEGTSHRGARRRVEAFFRRQTKFRPPATLTIGGGLSMADLSGALELASDQPGEPPLGAETREAAEVIHRASASPPVVVTGPSGLAEAAARLSPFADRTLDGDHAAGVWGTPDSPELTRLSGQAEISGTVSGAGILLAEAPLRVYGRLELDGLLLATAGLDLDGELVIRGGLWVDGHLRIGSHGRATVTSTTAALELCEQPGRGALPKAAILGAWREVW